MAGVLSLFGHLTGGEERVDKVVIGDIACSDKRVSEILIENGAGKKSAGDETLRELIVEDITGLELGEITGSQSVPIAVVRIRDSENEEMKD